MSLEMESIYSYITNNLFNEPASYKMRGIIEHKLSNISLFPNSGTSINSYLKDISHEFTDRRKINAKNYSLLYLHDEINSIVFITHIFHQTQDYAKIFQN